MTAAEEEWAAMMRAAILGDTGAYRNFLEAIAPVLRAAAGRKLAQLGAGDYDVEDVVQETLLAIHLKRGTWDVKRPIRPWLAAIARHKLIDVLRRRGRRAEEPIDEWEDLLVDQAETDPLSRHEIDRMVMQLNERQRRIVQALSAGASISDTARNLAMTDGAVRVALHRALAKLSSLYRKDIW